MKKFLSIIISFTFLTSLSISEEIQFSRLDTQSPWFSVAEEDLGLQESYSGINPETGEQFSHLTIGDKALEMIANAKKLVLASVFLFDTMKAQGTTTRDIVKEFTDLLVRKKKENPEIKIVIILDPINKAYGNFVAPAVEELISNHIDVFYSDLMDTKSATKLGFREGFHETSRFINRRLSFGLLGRLSNLLMKPKVPINTALGKGISLEMIWNAAALKANHRKILVTDSADTYEALVSSANPHNGSVKSANYSVTVKGETAKYIYMVLREDVKNSIRLKDVLWGTKDKKYRKTYLKEVLPVIEIAKSKDEKSVLVSFMTENQIKKQIIKMLDEVEVDDEVRIQIFYLSDFEVLKAIMTAAQKVAYPIKLIVDPSKDAFGSEKNGVPNRQTGSILMKESEREKLPKKLKKLFGMPFANELNLVVRWYDTHGEQNHAKIMSITNHRTGKYELINGSANWTGKNLKNINMEANLRIKGSRKLVNKFNDIFEKLWANTDAHYTIPYHEKFEEHIGLDKWINGENWGYVTW